MTNTAEPLLILDANILIDYFKCDKKIIHLIGTYVGQIHLARPILQEVHEICEEDCIDLGITIVEPNLNQLILAAGERRGPLSFQDSLCLNLAKEHGWTCVTNDKPLRKECESVGVPLMWGIELVCTLVESGGLSKLDAKTTMECMHVNNPRYITEAIIQRAFRRLDIEPSM